LRYASDELRADREVVLEAVRQDMFGFAMASDKLKSDKKFVIEAVSLHGNALCFVNDELKNDRDVLMAAVSQNGGALFWAGGSLSLEILCELMVRGELPNEFVDRMEMQGKNKR
jgi:hypothetical protein